MLLKQDRHKTNKGRKQWTNPCNNTSKPFIQLEKAQPAQNFPLSKNCIHQAWPLNLQSNKKKKKHYAQEASSRPKNVTQIQPKLDALRSGLAWLNPHVMLMVGPVFSLNNKELLDP